MSVSIDKASRKAVMRIRGLKKLTRSGVEHGAYVSGRGLIKSVSAEILKKPKGGATYVRRDKANRRRKHVASAAGETHANMSGALRRSLSFKASRKSLEFGYGVQSGDAPEYAAFVEFGTKRMKARPSLQNGINSEGRNMEKNFEREIGKRLEGRKL